MKYILILLLLFNSVYAIDITPIEKGQVAPYKGFLVSPEQMKEFRQINEDKKLLEQENLKLQDLQVINEQRIGLYKKAWEETNSELTKERFSGNFKGIGGFILGVALSGIAAYATIKTLK